MRDIVIMYMSVNISEPLRSKCQNPWFKQSAKNNRRILSKS